MKTRTLKPNSKIQNPKSALRPPSSVLRPLASVLCLLTSALCLPAFAQGTAFTYQGRLNDGANPASGIYDLRFTIYDSTNNPGVVIAGPLTNGATAVSNGLFTVGLDFGPGVFTGPPRWLAIAVRTNGSGAFSLLTPRQPLTAAPYAITAGGASNLLGSLSPGSLSGAYTNPVTFNNGANLFDGTFIGQFLGGTFIGGNFSGQFFGEGSGLINLNASLLASGTVPAARLANAWLTGGNAGTIPGSNFLGTTDNQPLEFKAKGMRALRLEGTANDVNHSNVVNIVGGSPANFISNGVYGATISGGGAEYSSGFAFYSNSVTADFGTVGGGIGNSSGGTYATVSGGQGNTASGYEATVGGGFLNTASGNYSTVGGGGVSTASGPSATIGGGQYNNASATSATVAGGQGNVANNYYATVGGGINSSASGTGATVPGGGVNIASGDFSFAAGQRAKAIHHGAFVWADSTAADFASTSLDQFLIRAGGGVGIGKTNPASALDVNGTVTASAFSGSGAGLANVNAATLGGLNSSNFWRTTGNAGTAPGVNFIGTTDSQALLIRASFVGVGRTTQITGSEFFGLDAPAGSGNFGGMYINTTNATAKPFYGYALGGAALAYHYLDGTDGNKWKLSQGGSDRVVVTTAGNVGIGNNSPTNLLMVGTARCDGTLWINGSDRNLKENFTGIDPLAILEKVAQLPLTRWNFKARPADTHLGPMAQDFKAAFDLGADHISIATVDADGVALAAIQGLNQKVEAGGQKAEVRIQNLEAENAELKRRLEALEKIMLTQKTN